MMSLAGGAGSRGGVIGWFMTADGIGHAAGPATAGVLLALLGAHAVLVVAGAMFLAVACIATTQRFLEHEPAYAPLAEPSHVAPPGAREPISLTGGQS